MFKKAVSVLLSTAFAVGLCTAGNHGKLPSTDHAQCKVNLPTIQELQQKKYLGEFRLTFYTPYEDKWGYQTATGVRSQHLKTCAVDPNVIPLGSVLEITGDNGRKITVKAVDIGGMVKGRSIDLFFDGGSREANQFMEEFGEIHAVYLLEE